MGTGTVPREPPRPILKRTTLFSPRESKKSVRFQLPAGHGDRPQSASPKRAPRKRKRKGAPSADSAPAASPAGTRSPVKRARSPDTRFDRLSLRVQRAVNHKLLQQSRRVASALTGPAGVAASASGQTAARQGSAAAMALSRAQRRRATAPDDVAWCGSPSPLRIRQTASRQSRIQQLMQSVTSAQQPPTAQRAEEDASDLLQQLSDMETRAKTAEAAAAAAQAERDGAMSRVQELEQSLAQATADAKSRVSALEIRVAEAESRAQTLKKQAADMTNRVSDLEDRAAEAEKCSEDAQARAEAEARRADVAEAEIARLRDAAVAQTTSTVAIAATGSPEAPPRQARSTPPALRLQPMHRSTKMASQSRGARLLFRARQVRGVVLETHDSPPKPPEPTVSATFESTPNEKMTSRNFRGSFSLISPPKSINKALANAAKPTFTTQQLLPASPRATRSRSRARALQAAAAAQARIETEAVPEGRDRHKTPNRPMRQGDMVAVLTDQGEFLIGQIQTLTRRAKTIHWWEEIGGKGNELQFRPSYHGKQPWVDRFEQDKVITFGFDMPSLRVPQNVIDAINDNIAHGSAQGGLKRAVVRA